MFSSLRLKILLGVYLFLIISIPTGAYFLSQQTTFKSSASEAKPTSSAKSTAKPGVSAAKDLQNQSEALVNQNFSPSPAPDIQSTTATSFGPTLSLKVNLEGRPADNQAGKLFVGIVEGTISTNPKFVLSFSVDLPASGVYSGLSLAGLTPGTQYTALLKGPSQIGSASAFTMSPSVSNLNNGEAITLLTGDLNEDNAINSSDYTIAQKALGSTKTSANWNENADFNKDGVINSLDLSFIKKNLGKIGDSGAWTSPLPQNATPSATLNSSKPIGGLPDGKQGYWIFVPAQ